MNRIIKILAFLAFLLSILSAGAQDRASMIEAQIRPVVFPDKEYRISEFGASSVWGEDCLPAIRAAIDLCNREGGGTVVIPSGRWFSKGPVVLKSHVNLHLEEGAELVFSSDTTDYLPPVLTRWEGSELYNYSPLIYAYEAVDVAVTGKGTINGQGSRTFAQWKPSQKADQQKIRRLGSNLVPVQDRIFGAGHRLRPAMLEFLNCSNVLVEGVRFIDSPFWVIHPIGCENVTVRGVTVDSFNLNNDGCDPESCTNVLIENCTFITGDDGIAIKSGRDNDAWRIGRPTENVLIRNSSFRSKANGVCIGSEISGGVRNVVIQNVSMNDVGNGIYFKSNLDRGGFIEDIYVSGVKADSVRKSLVIFEPDYKSESKANYPTSFRNFLLEDIEGSWAGGIGIDIRGFSDMPVRNVSIRNLNLMQASQPLRIENAEAVELGDVVINGQRLDRREPEKEISLNGKWDVAISEVPPTEYASTVSVPGIISMAVPSLKPDLHALESEDVDYDHVYYRRYFDLDVPAYKRAILKLRARYNAQVFLNGKEIGYDPHTSYSFGTFDVSDAIDYHGRNELVVKVGSWNTATFPSKENSAEWWRSSRSPGIWDDVTLCLGQDVSIDHIQVIPDVAGGTLHCKVTISNSTTEDISLNLYSTVFDDMLALSRSSATAVVPAGGSTSCEMILSGAKLKKWSAGKEGNPKLYNLEVLAVDGSGATLSRKSSRFGYRSIETSGCDVLVNGSKTIFRAENIAFVRALNRWADVMFDEDWIRNFLRAAVQNYNLNYLRMHLGHAYSKWYDIADEEGIMIQDEWKFMHDDEPVGKDLEDTEVEFRRWIRDNVNHPSIVAWDQENEGNVRLTNLKKELREYDPSRLWSEDDFIAKHIYEYSENVVKGFDGYDISADKPSTVLESCRLWTNEFGMLEPRENFKTSRTASGWNLYYYDQDDIGRLLADLHADIGTFYRSRRIQAWAPFALLSGCVNGHNFFLGDIADSLRPQPNLLVLKRLNEPVGSSVEMNQAREWYKDKVLYKPGGMYSKEVWIWNDYPKDVNLRLRLILRHPDGSEQICAEDSLSVQGSQSIERNYSFALPKQQGIYFLEPRLLLGDGSEVRGVERRLMVAGNMSYASGKMAFGGRWEPVPEGCSIIENFTRQDTPLQVQKGIISVVKDGLIDKIEVSEAEGKTYYAVQSTKYESNAMMVTSSLKFNSKGRLLETVRYENLNYGSLPASVRRILIEETGSVPAEDTRVIRRQETGGTIYEFTPVGTNLKYRLKISDDGVLLDKKITQKKKK